MSVPCDGVECEDILLQEECPCYFNVVPSGKKYIIISEPPIGTMARVILTTPKGLLYTVLSPGIPHY